MRLYKTVITSALVIMILLVSTILSLFYASDSSLNFLAQRFFNSDELTITAIEGAELKLSGLTIHRAEITAPSYAATAKDLSISYNLAGLYRGTFQKISLAELKIRIIDGDAAQQPDQTDNTNESDSLESMLDLVANKPFDELFVQQLHVLLPNDQIDGSFKIASKPSSISGQLSAKSLPTLQLAMNSSIIANEPLALSIKLIEENRSIFETEVALTIEQNSLGISGISEIAVQDFLAVAHNFALLPDLTSRSASLQLNTNLEIENVLTDPSVHSLDVAINNQAGSIQFLLDNEGEPLLINIALPLQLNSRNSTSKNLISLETQSIDIAAVGQLGEIEVNASVNANEVTLNCVSIYDCEIGALLTVNSSGLHTQDWGVEELLLSGFVTGSLRNGIYSLQGSDSVFSLLGAEYDRTKTSVTSTLTQWQITQPRPNSSNTDHSISLDTETIDITASGEVAGIQFDSTINTSDLILNCNHTFDCRLNASLAAKIANMRSQNWSTEELSLATAVEATLSGGSYSVSGKQTAINILTGSYAEATTSFDSLFSQWAIEVSDTQLMSAQAQFQIDDWDLDYGEFALEEPVFNGNFSLSNNEFAATIVASVQSSLKISAQINSNLNTGSGNLNIEVPQISLTQATPLSSYIQGSDSQFDIIAGEIAATSSIDWITDTVGTLQLAGPISLKMENLSGNYEDYFFFGLTTDLSAEAANPLGLKSSGVQTARIETAELGLPIRDISWAFEFDSTNSTMAIYDLTGNLLGGKVSVPEAKFKDLSSNTELTVVISDLDLALVTDLVEYPELQVQGFASGYLPIYLQNGVITMRKGLVSALNPGGSIRYNPVNPSTNASIKFVNDALSNYQFKTLDSELNYNESGDLNMQVNLRGGNPDMPAGQQINVNLNIVNNVPDMLESLRASRSIEDALERNLQRRK